MALNDPFAELAISPQTACRFFAMYSRCEYAMKETAYEMYGNGGFSAADWDRLGRDATKWLQVTAGSALDQAIYCLLKPAPEVQMYRVGWRRRNLRGKGRVAQAIAAVTRVRNNLFHGGKHHKEQYPGRDQALVDAALVLLTEVLECSTGDLRDVFNDDY